MFMRFLGHGIGHKVTESYIHERTPEHAMTPNTELDLEEDEIGAHDIEILRDGKDGGDEDTDIEEVESVDAEEEADFGYENEQDRGNNKQDEQEDSEDDDDDED